MGHSCSSQSTATGPPSEADRATTMQRVRQFRCFGITTVEAIAFWSAVTLPVPTVGVLVGGVVTTTEFGVVAVLLLANLLAFYLGHDYGRRQPTPDTL